MDTVQILIYIYGLKVGISDENICYGIRKRLELSGILTINPKSLTHDDDTLLIDIGVRGTFEQDAIVTAVTSYLEGEVSVKKLGLSYTKVIVIGPQNVLR